MLHSFLSKLSWFFFQTARKSQKVVLDTLALVTEIDNWSQIVTSNMKVAKFDKFCQSQQGTDLFPWLYLLSQSLKNCCNADWTPTSAELSFWSESKSEELLQKLRSKECSKIDGKKILAVLSSNTNSAKNQSLLTIEGISSGNIRILETLKYSLLLRMGESTWLKE
jgi:hypothetical protein